MNFYKKLGEIRPNQLITTYGPGSIMDAVNDSLTVLDIEYWDTNNIGKEIRDARLASYMILYAKDRWKRGYSSCVISILPCVFKGNM